MNIFPNEIYDSLLEEVKDSVGVRHLSQTLLLCRPLHHRNISIQLLLFPLCFALSFPFHSSLPASHASAGLETPGPRRAGGEGHGIQGGADGAPTAPEGGKKPPPPPLGECRSQLPLFTAQSRQEINFFLL